MESRRGCLQEELHVLVAGALPGLIADLDARVKGVCTRKAGLLVGLGAWGGPVLAPALAAVDHVEDHRILYVAGQPHAQVALLLVEPDHDTEPDHGGEGAGDPLADEENGSEANDRHDEGAVLVRWVPDPVGVVPTHGKTLEADAPDRELQHACLVQREGAVDIKHHRAREDLRPVFTLLQTFHHDTQTRIEAQEPEQGQLILHQQPESDEAPDAVEGQLLDAGEVDRAAGVDDEAQQDTADRHVRVHQALLPAHVAGVQVVDAVEVPVDEEERRDHRVDAPMRHADGREHRHQTEDGECLHDHHEGGDVRLNDPEVKQIIVG
eukprot:764435-Hanusia_phi.AAC.3